MDEDTRQEPRVLALEMRAGFPEVKARVGELRQQQTELRQKMVKEFSALRQEMVERFDAVLGAVADLANEYRGHYHGDEDGAT